jgi:signal transduction histidine kinase
MSRSANRSYLWAFYTAAGFLFAGTVLRSVALAIDDDQVPLSAFLLLFVWLLLFVSEPFISRLWRPWFTIYLVLETAIVVPLLILHDLYALLFGVLSMHAMLRYGLRYGAPWLVLFVPLTALPLLQNPEYDPPEVAALTLMHTAANVFLAAYALACRRAAEARQANEALARELRDANADLEEYSRRLEGLVVARERNRLARELHDSVTQTIFSMTLASQSAGLLLDRDPPAADAQLNRLGRLAQSALAEMHTLVAGLAPDVNGDGGLRGALGREVERRAASDGMRVSLEIDDPPVGVSDRHVLSPQEEQALLRIAQEALNNVAKHSGVLEATIRLRLAQPVRMEIEDSGRGFDVTEAGSGPGFGLESMKQRAAEIGWDLELISRAGVARGSWRSGCLTRRSDDRRERGGREDQGVDRG